MFYTIKVRPVLPSCWPLIHNGSGLRGGEVHSAWWENGVWVTYVEVVVVGGLTECFCSWETGSWSLRLAEVGCYPSVPRSDMPRVV